MAAGSVILFSKNKADIRINDIVGSTIKIGLVTNSWTPDASVTGNSLWSDMSANEISAVFGYTAGGVALGSLVATSITTTFTA